MSTLHVFAIGGTGSRVLRSLTMLLAAGVKCDMDIRPVIVDPDHSNEDVSRCSMLIQDYCKLRKKLTFDTSSSNGFFPYILHGSWRHADAHREHFRQTFQGLHRVDKHVYSQSGATVWTILRRRP